MSITEADPRIGQIYVTRTSSTGYSLLDPWLNVTGARDLTALLERIYQLERLEPGWLDGEGAPPTRAALHQARGILANLVMRGAPRPRVYPTPEGGIEAEWTVGKCDISAAFSPSGVLSGAATNVSSGESQEFGEDEKAEERLELFVLRAT
jgi:hypothetical protein